MLGGIEDKVPRSCTKGLLRMLLHLRLVSEINNQLMTSLQSQHRLRPSISFKYANLEAKVDLRTDGW
jgi:hypothetical protein